MSDISFGRAPGVRRRVPGFNRVCSLERVQSVTNTYQEYLNYSRVTHVDELKIRISTHFEICCNDLPSIQVNIDLKKKNVSNMPNV